MGLGKTLTSLYFANKKKKPAIIVCPASVKLQWQKEIDKWKVKGDVFILNGRTVDKELLWEINTSDCQYIIINYDILTYWVDDLIKLNPNILIVDEIHYCKNYKSKRTLALQKLSRVANRFIGLTGTPIKNNAVDLFPILNMMNPDDFDNFFTFAKRYSYVKKIRPKNRYARVRHIYTGVKNSDELYNILKPMMFRKLKNEVLDELPEKNRITQYVDIDNKRDYNSIVLEDKPIFMKYGALRQVTAQGKIKQSIEWIEDFLEETCEKLVIACHYKVIVEQLMRHFKGKAVKIVGGMSSKEKNESINNFNNKDGVRLCIGNIQAIGTGIDGLQDNCSNMCVIELPMTVADMLQLEDRLNRMGQKNAVNIYYIIGEKTIDEQICQLLIKKASIFNAIVEGVAEDDTDIMSSVEASIVTI